MTSLDLRYIEIILLAGLVICAIAASLCRKLLTSVIVFMSYSSIMAVVWVILLSPDLAITEAAVGAGVTSILFFATLKKIHTIDSLAEADGEQDNEQNKR